MKIVDVIGGGINEGSSEFEYQIAKVNDPEQLKQVVNSWMSRFGYDDTNVAPKNYRAAATAANKKNDPKFKRMADLFSAAAERYLDFSPVKENSTPFFGVVLANGKEKRLLAINIPTYKMAENVRDEFSSSGEYGSGEIFIVTEDEYMSDWEKLYSNSKPIDYFETQFMDTFLN